MPECVWLKACAGVSGNALLMGAAIRQPSPLSQRKTRWKHAACQRLIKERSSVYNTAERNSKSLCSPRALSGGSPALLNAPVTILHTPLTVYVCIRSTAVVAILTVCVRFMREINQRFGKMNVIHVMVQVYEFDI